MKLCRLRLTNIGVFYGSYDFNLRTSSYQKNIVLFGGKNGSGKTTILESIRLALYGPLAFGYKTETAPYYEMINAKLNNVAVKNKENKYQIILDFELVEDYERTAYILRRSWTKTKSSIKEELSIQRKLRELSDQEKEVFISKLREEMPPQLLEFYLFDGERISQVISDNTLPEYLRQSAKVMFNIDLFETLEEDLKNYIKQETISNKLSGDEKLVLDIEENLKKIFEQREVLLEEKTRVEVNIDEQKSLLKALNNDYEVHGGLLKTQREELLQEMNNIERYRGGMMEKNKEVISTILPFCLARDLLANVVTQMEEESKQEIILNLKSVIHDDQIANAISILQESGDLTLKGDLNLIANRLFSTLLNTFESKEFPLVQKASVQQRMETNRLFEETLLFDPTIIKNNFLENENLIDRVRQIRNKINANDSIGELKELFDDIKQVENNLVALQHRLDQLTINLTMLEEKILVEQESLDQVNLRVIQSRKKENVFLVVNKAMEVSKKFRGIQLRKKLQQVEMETAKMLQLLFRKELFVVRVFIHPENFVLKLYNINNEEINKEILSAGEKQILLLATIWAMAKCSKRKMPFVFDTLLGRLDQTHKKRIIQHFLPECGEQVIILSTDSEIDLAHFELIKPAISRTYTIEMNNLKSHVETSNQYFHFQSNEGVEIL